MHTKKNFMMVLFSIVLFNSSILFSATKQDKTDCHTSSFTQGLCNITQTVCVTFQDKKNQDGVYDYIVVWERVLWDCGLAGKGSKSGNTFEGDFKFRDTNNIGYFNDNPFFDPGPNDSLVSFVASPLFDPSNPDSTFYHNTFEVAYRDKNTMNLTGVFSKEVNDSEPLYISYTQIGPSKMSGTWNTEFFEEIAKELVNIYTNITPVVYPNPTSGVITMSINEPVKNYMLNNTEIRKIDVVKIVNMKGELVYFEKNVDLATPLKIDLQNLPSGTYILIVNIDKMERNTSFILNK